MGFERRAIILQHIDNEVIKQSTAGGAFSAIAEYVIQKDGVVFGVEIDEELSIKHTSVESIEELRKLRSSKYVQSDVGNSFKRIREYLEIGRIVCFVGTPCQVQGLRCFLDHDYNNLILIDMVCRAVPSPGVWKKYIQMEEEEIGRITSVSFRDKKLGYQYSTMVIRTADGKEYRGGIESQSWLRMFFSGMIIRPSCSACRFRYYERNSDFTIWDCFPSYKFDKTFDEKIGTTRMLINSEKGNSIFNSIRNRLIFTELSVPQLISDVDEMKRSPLLPDSRDNFYSVMNKHGLKAAIHEYFPNTIKIKIKVLCRRTLNALGLDTIAKRVFKRFYRR